MGPSIERPAGANYYMSRCPTLARLWQEAARAHHCCQRAVSLAGFSGALGASRARPARRRTAQQRPILLWTRPRRFRLCRACCCAATLSTTRPVCLGHVNWQPYDFELGCHFCVQSTAKNLRHTWRSLGFWNCSMSSKLVGYEASRASPVPSPALQVKSDQM